MDIVFVRHGRTVINEQGRYGGILDTEICQQGIDEVKRLAHGFQDIEFDAIYVSSLKRAIQTADLLVGDYMIDQRLKEMNFGLFEGLTYKEISEKYPIESKAWEQDYVNYRLPEGESLYDVYQRTQAFINDVRNRHNKVLAVTHGGVIRCALSLVMGDISFFYKFKVDHGMTSVISIENDFMYIKGINSGGSI